MKKPKNRKEAFDLIFTISEEHGLSSLIVSQEDFEHQAGTENWTNEDYKKAIELAFVSLCDATFFEIETAIDKVNKRKPSQPLDK